MAQTDFDVIIIGGGGAGMSAALAAAEAGVSVLLVEASARCGGATMLSSGAFYAANTRVQRAAGIDTDTPRAMFTYAMALNRYRMQPAVLQRFCEEGSEALHWLLDLGVKIKRISPSDVSGSGIPRSHWVDGGGAGITEVLEGRLQSAGVEVVTRTRVQKLVKDNGNVAGIEIDGAIVRAKAIVVASGGFGANEELLARYLPSQVKGRWYVGPPTSQGDAFGFGAAVGADLYGENRGLHLMSPGLNRTLEVAPGWLVFVNRHGQRFMNEDAAYGIQNSAMEGQPDQTAFAIMDQAAFDEPPSDFRFAPLIAAGELTTDWRHDTLETALQAGKILKGETLEELASLAGIEPAEALVQTVARYNADVAAGADSLFFKNPGHLRQLSGGPYYAAVLTMQILGITSCGLRIDRDAKVQDRFGRAIPGVYAAGEAAGGVMGEVYIGSGNSVAGAITYGRIAGKNAAQYAQTSMAAAEHGSATADA